MGKKRAKPEKNQENTEKTKENSEKCKEVGEKGKEKPDKTPQSVKSAKAVKVEAESESPEDDHGLGGEEAVLFEYMLGQNRPYSALNIHDNLRGAVKKAQCQKLLDKLVDNGKLQAKEFGKVKIYLVNQQLIPTISEGELNQLDNQIKDLTEELESARSQVKELQIQAKELENAMSTEEIEKAIEESTKNYQGLNSEINELQQMGCVTEEMRKDIENKLKVGQAEERKRLKIYNGLLSGIADMLDEPLKKVKELIGIEE